MRTSQVALVVKNPPANAGDIRDASLTPGSGRSPEGEYGNPPQYSCLENLRGQKNLAEVHKVTIEATYHAHMVGIMYTYLYILAIKKFLVSL